MSRASSEIAPDEAGERRDSIPASAATRPRGDSRASRMMHSAGTTFSQSRPPVGMFHAFGSVGSNIPSLKDIQDGSFKPDGWSAPEQRRNSRVRRESNAQALNLQRQQTLEAIPEPQTSNEVSQQDEKKANVLDGIDSVKTPSTEAAKMVLSPHDPSVPYENGYQFPPKHGFWKATIIALHGFWNFFITPFGFILTIYALNIVAWGGMLFLILIHATPAMAHPSWNDDYSGAKIWLEIDSQILNALFNVTGIGLIPWRFRDFYYLLKWRYGKDELALRKLAGIHRNWFRLEGSQEISVTFNQATDGLPPGINESALAYPITMSPDPPLTGERASASKYWKLDFVIWGFVWNTLLQIALNGIMWGMNRFERPGWATGLLISLACIVASAAGWVIYKEGKRVKRVEGVPVSKEDADLLKEKNSTVSAV